ncbi:hypothetical protein ACQ4PT_061575 [Festuca glaucescens]
MENANADVTTSEYHRYKVVRRCSSAEILNFNVYQFSISWSRLFPDGEGTINNKKGVVYYNNLIDYVLKKGNLNHYDIPLELQKKYEDFLSPKIVLNQEDFEEHAEKAKTLPESTTNEDKLILYGLYKQATVGDVNTHKPKEEAMSDYITKVKQLLEEAAAAGTS